jgi:polar amino acid transport system permease protein
MLSELLSHVMEMLPPLAKGLVTSINIFLLTLLCACPLGMVIAFGRMNRHLVINGPIRLFISVMRGTPLMLQLLVVYFGPYYIFRVSLAGYPPFLAVIIAFSINYAVYFAEIYRAGIQSIPVGQYEAATVLGYSKLQTFFKIILPQVIKRILPPMTNETITLVKDTSLAQVIAVAEMFTIAKRLANAQSSVLALAVAGLFYYIFNFIVAMVMEKCEKCLDYYR